MDGDSKKYLRGWDSVKNFEYDGLLSAYKELLIKYNTIVIKKEEKYRNQMINGKRCCSCSMYLSRNGYDPKCHKCGLWPCKDCNTDCPHKFCTLCKTCAPDINECSNCHKKHCNIQHNSTICDTCVAHQCVTCKKIDNTKKLGMYHECSACETLRSKTCGALVNVYTYKDPRYQNWTNTKPPNGCGKFVDKVNGQGICESCEHKLARTCKICSNVTDQKLQDNMCNICYQKWYVINKCIRCKLIKSVNPNISSLNYCDKCFEIFEKCCIC